MDLFELAADVDQRLVEPASGFGADHEQIEDVGERITDLAVARV